MDSITITHHDHGDRGEYVAHLTDAAHKGRLTWKAAGEGVRIVDHTLVPPAIGGRGIAAELVRAVIADAREQGFRIVPQCSYVAVMFDRNPAWADLWA